MLSSVIEQGMTPFRFQTTQKNSASLRSSVPLRLTCFTDLFQTWWNVNRWVAGRCATQQIGCQGLLMVVQFSSTRADQNTGGALSEFSMRTAMHERSRVSKISPCSLTSGVAQWGKRWTRDHRIVQSVVSSPPGRRLLELFQQLFLSLSFARPSELQ